ncbi:phosphoglucomutase [Dokdonia pacifica]|uniref:Phosphoglucomutase n=1 Tax=Dokdonia pacifica TaxID=1627892 RepID=A0A239B2D6_9FLAO|nr:phospho-sugar mutase [Dokdonia pacifica]GGG33057.1 phosphoglucomutase [Dokdonia pacifica]SNS01969.1 phosphoglucomutase [Dokdonia pacifica]
MIYHKPEILEKANAWLTDTFDTETQDAIKDTIAYNPEELEDSFYKNLEFGTGGMRGVMGPGTNRINKYTLGKNTQGLSNYLKKTFPETPIKVAIAYDCRHNSKELAKVVADVFSANGIDVFLFSDLRPTPELSFAVKHLDCQCGIVLTASHNPPEYNGYKVYWVDGGQLVPPQDKEIIQEIESLDFKDIQFQEQADRITYIDKEVDKAFIDASVANVTSNVTSSQKEELSIVFTSLHGTSITLVPDTLKQAGFTNLHIVEEQAVPDGNFPTVDSPNPEESSALQMALTLGEEKNADIVIGTDPDCDRLGIAVRGDDGKLAILNGNQTMILMTDYLLERFRESKNQQDNPFVGSTIVSTPMMDVLAQSYNVECKIGLTGFKWIAKMIQDFPEQYFIGGGEESFGYMVGDFVRDKDAVTSTLLACTIAARAKAHQKTLYQKLKDLYIQHGFYKESLISLVKKGQSGAAEIKQMLLNLRENPMKEINGSKVVRVEDYQSQTATNSMTGATESIDIPASNVLIYYTEDGSKIAARPSGTEPKVKFYISVQAPLHDLDSYDTISAQLDNRIAGIKNALGV